MFGRLKKKIQKSVNELRSQGLVNTVNLAIFFVCRRVWFVIHSKPYRLFYCRIDLKGLGKKKAAGLISLLKEQNAKFDVFTECRPADDNFTVLACYNFHREIDVLRIIDTSLASLLTDHTVHFRPPHYKLVTGRKAVRKLEEEIEPDEAAEINIKVKNASKYHRCRYRSIKELSTKKSRGKIEIIDYNGEQAVKKTFKPGREFFLENEIFACQILSAEQEMIPKIMERGDNYLIIPYYKNILSGQGTKQKKRILNKYKNEIIRFIYYLYRKNLTLIDFKDDSIIVEPSGKIKCIDFEFIHPYQTTPATFLECYELSGVPTNYRGPLPFNYKYNRSFNETWKGVFTLEDIIEYENNIR